VGFDDLWIILVFRGLFENSAWKSTFCERM
jgi:hypothetical protein